MNELGEKLVLYIGKTTGLSVRLTPFDAGKLPLYMKASDDFYTGAVDTAKVLFVVQKKNTEQTRRIIRKRWSSSPKPSLSPWSLFLKR